MKSPELYTILKIPLQKFAIENKVKHKYIKDGKEKIKYKTSYLYNENIELSNKDINEFTVSQQYNHLFRIIIKYKLKNNEYIVNNKIDDVIFIDCKNNKNYQSVLENIVRNGVIVNGIKYLYWGKSASMSRHGVLGMVSEKMYNVVETHAMMDIKLDKVVLSKFEAYKCLLLSSCFCIEEDIPYMIVVPDYETIVKNVKIKYVDEIEKNYIDKNTGEEKIFKEKVIKEGIKDIPNCINDGAGLCSIEQAKRWQEYLKISYLPCIYMLRVPYVKGLVISVDFKTFYKEYGISEITDLWGHKHKVEDIDIILTESQYKGYKYFKQNKDYSDWERYLNLLKKYDYCIGISKWNYSHENEPRMTRCNYQTLQTLDITTQDLIEMSSYTRKWIERILSGDLLYVLKYLGLKEDSKPSNLYMKSILYNPQMADDIKIRSYLYNLLRKTIDEIKIGKFHIKGAFKVLIPDVIFMMEYIGGLKPKGCLKEGEMYAKEHKGNYVLNRNPHICRSEHVILKAKQNKLTQKWLNSHFANVCMVNAFDVTPKRLNGADCDGDLVFTHNNPIYMKGIHNDLPIVLDIEDKITAKEVEYNKENIIDFVISSLDSRIGEISNCASSYHNKCPKTEEKKRLYDDYTCLLSVVNGKEIDRAKTGVRWNVPRKIQQGVKPLPYFLKYKYHNQKRHSYAKSKMNEHCWYIEKWQRKLRYSNDFVNTSHCVISKDLKINSETLEIIEKHLKMIIKDYKNYKSQEKMARDYDRYKDFFDGLTKEEVENTYFDWESFFTKHRKELLKLIDEPNFKQERLANYMTELIYNKYNGNYYDLLWGICEEGIMINLKHNRVKPILVPKESKDGKGREYLGRKYDFVEYTGDL